MKYQKVRVVKHYFGGGGGAPSTTTAPTIPEWAVPYAQDILGETKNLYMSGDLSSVAGTNANLDSARFEGAEGIKDTTRNNQGYLAGQMDRAVDAAKNTSMQRNVSEQALRDQMDRLTGGALDGNRGFQDQYVTQKLGEQTALNNTTFGANGTLGSARNMQANANAAAKIGADSAQQIFNNQVTVEKGIGESADRNMNRQLAAEKVLSDNAQNQLGLLTGATNTVANLGQQERAIMQQFADSKLKGIQNSAGIFTGATPKEQALPGQTGGK